METKSADAHDLRQHEGERGHFQHRAHQHLPRLRAAEQSGAFDLPVDQRARLIEFGDIADHRQQHAQRDAGGCGEQRAHLIAQQRRPIERDADRAPAERRIFLPLPARIGQHLVAAQIERAKHHRLVARCIEDLLVERDLVGQTRHRLADHELQFGAEQPDAIRAGFLQMRHVEQQAGIHHQLDRHAVLRHGGQIAQLRKLRHAIGAHRALGLEHRTRHWASGADAPRRFRHRPR